MTPLRTYFLRFRREEDGTALVEFAVALPLMLLFFAVAIEGGRTFWAYQATIAGVRDATRFITRAQQVDVCDTSGNLNAWTSRATDIVRNSSSGAVLFPGSITVSSVTPTLTCVTGDFHQSTVPLATVTAQLEITYPFSGLFAFLGLELPTVATSVSDTGRIFGA